MAYDMRISVWSSDVGASDLAAATTMVPLPAPSAGPSAPAVSIRANLIRSLVAVGSAWRSSAAAPATWGAEKLVPLPRRWASSTKLGYRRSASLPGDRRECTLWPGATTSGLATPSASVGPRRSEEHTSELQSLMRISYAVFCL